jgi:hypothetical protein
VVTDHSAVYGMVRMYMSLGDNDGTVECFETSPPPTAG